MLREELSFWIAVGLVAVASVALFKIAAASKAGESIPGLRELAEIV